MVSYIALLRRLAIHGEFVASVCRIERAILVTGAGGDRMQPRN